VPCSPTLVVEEAQDLDVWVGLSLLAEILKQGGKKDRKSIGDSTYEDGPDHMKFTCGGVLTKYVITWFLSLSGQVVQSRASK